MTMKRIFPIALGMAMVAFANVQGYAFMVEASEVPAPVGEIDVIATVDQLKAAMKNDELSCEEKMAKLDVALDSVDNALDAGVQDEEKYLAARDAIVQMRLELPCLAERLVQGDADGGGVVLSDQVIGESIVDAGVVSDGGVLSTGNYRSTSRGGGGGHHGHGKRHHLGLLAAGTAAAIAIPLATSDDSAPGMPASPSTP